MYCCVAVCHFLNIMCRPFADSFAQSYIHGGSACATARFAFRRPCQKKEGHVIHSIMHLHTYLRLRVVARVCAAIPTFCGSYEICWSLHSQRSKYKKSDQMTWFYPRANAVEKIDLGIEHKSKFRIHQS